jgi:hypothetical protein
MGNQYDFAPYQTIDRLPSFLGFEVPAAISMKRFIDWNVTLHNPAKVNGRFGGTHHLSL